MTRSYKRFDIFEIKILHFEFFHNLLNVQKWLDKIFFQGFELNFFLKLEYRIDRFRIDVDIVFFFLKLISFLSGYCTGNGVDDCEFSFLPFGQTEIGKFLYHGAMG